MFLRKNLKWWMLSKSPRVFLGSGSRSVPPTVFQMRR